MAFGRVVAARSGATGSNGTVIYYLANHLGSTTQTIDGAGVVGFNVKYWPFGGQRNGYSAPEKAYTGQQREANSPIGAYYYHARFYSTTLGHFMSADSVVPEPTQRGLNRYAYAYNNPVRYLDPSGHCVWNEPCQQSAMENFVKCGFGHGCGNENSSSEEIANLQSLSRWLLRQQSFFELVSWHARASRDFWERIVSYRRLYWPYYMTNESLYIDEDAASLEGGPGPVREHRNPDNKGLNEGPGAASDRGVEATATLQAVSITFSYLDIRVFAFGAFDVEGIDFRAMVQIDEGGWIGYGLQGRFLIPFSFFDRSHYSLQVAFDLVSYRNLGAPVFYDSQSSTTSSTFEIPLDPCGFGRCAP